MAQLCQACTCKTAQDSSSYSELVTGVDSYVRQHQEKKRELVIGLRYAHSSIGGMKEKNSTCSSSLSSMANDLLWKIKINPPVCPDAILTELLMTIAGPTPATRENTCPPLQETDPSCTGVMILTNCDIIVQR